MSNNTTSEILFPIDTTLGCTVKPMDKELSLYIPVIPPNLYFISSKFQGSKKFEPKYLKYYIERTMRIGKVRRIDFITHEVQQFRTPQIGAFIHFDCLFENNATNTLLKYLSTDKKYLSYGYGRPGIYDSYCRFLTNTNRPAHLLFKINYKPIEQSTEYTRNIEQVIAENKLLIKQLQEKEEAIRQLELELKIESMTQ